MKFTCHLFQFPDQYQPMEAKIKRVMEGELKVIVQEEK